jgi:hypothetical protein
VPPAQSLDRVRLGEDEGETAVDGVGQVLGQMSGDVASLVQNAALYHCSIGETFLMPAAKALAPSMTQSTPDSVSPPGDEVGQEGGDDRLVLSVATTTPRAPLPPARGQVGVAPGGRSGQHALDDEGVKQVHRAECLPGVELYLGPACSGPRAPGLDLASARTTDPLVVPCQWPSRSPVGILACFSKVA